MKSSLPPPFRYLLLLFFIYSSWNVYLFFKIHSMWEFRGGRSTNLLLDNLKSKYARASQSARKYENRIEEFVGPLAKEMAEAVGDLSGAIGITSNEYDGSDGNDVVTTRRKSAGRRQNTRRSSSEGKQENARNDEANAIGSGDELKVDSIFDDQNFPIVKAAAEEFLSVHGPGRLRQILSAYVEPPLQDRDTSAPYDQGEAKNAQNPGKPPTFIEPLPLRTQGPDDLKKFEYPKLQTCEDIPGKMPVDAGLLFDSKGEHIIKNVNNKQTIQNAIKDAEYCPVNADPFLPWVHDVFPSPSGRTIHFVAQNKRRCNTGNRFLKDLELLEPQVALMQPISVERIDEGKARELAPELWHPENEGEEGVSHSLKTTPRYRLAPFEASDPDAQYTRFICRYHSTRISSNGKPVTTIIGETLSTFPMNYELANYRKGMPSYGSMLTPKGKDNAQFWLSNLRFDCPVPDLPGLAKVIASGAGILSDGTPLIHVDIVPIRTSPRFGVHEVYFTEELAGPASEIGTRIGDRYNWSKSMGIKPGEMGFNATKRWGYKNVVPRIEASGRIVNIPLCRPPPPTLKDEELASKDEPKALAVVGADDALDAPTDPKRKKKHDLVGCLWAAAAYTTRGHENKIEDTEERLIEWIEFNLLVGFDHIYIYDNTGAHTNSTDLRKTLARFTSAEVTRVEWPFRVCNNNVPAHENTGERSSQYAAEASCRQRYGAHSKWVAAVDPDEYLVPMGKYENLKDMLRDAESKGTEIIGFKSTRASPTASLMLPFHDDKKCGTQEEPKCLQKAPGTLNLELYNCDVEKLPKPEWAMRAKKQIYQPSYVYSHYVHYSTITRGLVESCEHLKLHGKPCPHKYSEKRPTERFSDERKEAVMIHSKTLVPRDTVDWRERCKPGFKESHNVKCRVGFPVPGYDESLYGTSDNNGMKYNCYSYQKVSEVWIPRLKRAIKEREEKFMQSDILL